jgi:cytochrome c-type biogenesis protein
MISFKEFPVIASFVAGIATFVSPCVLPLIPAYLSFITGSSLDELKQGNTLYRTAISALAFIAGFALVFTLLGASASYLGNLLYDHRKLLRWVGGILVILFGLHLTGVLRISFLYREKKLAFSRPGMGIIGSFLIGVAFAIGWTPCVGPILSSILILASAQETVHRGMLLLSAYSLGLGIPFLLTALFVNRALGVFSAIKKKYMYIEIASGVVLAAVGVLLLTDSLKFLTGFLSGY